MKIVGTSGSGVPILLAPHILTILSISQWRNAYLAPCRHAKTALRFSKAVSSVFKRD